MTYTVRKGHRYRAHLNLSWVEGLASNETVEDKLRSHGFTHVHCEGSGKSRWAFGSWEHEDSSAPLPPEIDRVEEIA
jgi:hypothetical protein